MVKSKVSKRIFALAAVITIIIFIIGIYFGYFISEEKFNSLKIDFERLQLQQKDTELESNLLNFIGLNSCESLNYELDKATSMASDLGGRVSYYDSEIIKNPEFYTLKKQYILTLIQYWSYWELYKKNCNSSVNTILYFYSIDGCDDCSKQGFVLTYLKQRYPKEIMIFALDYNEDLYSLNLLKNVYGIKTTPTLIINKEKYEGLKDLNSLKEVLNLDH
jgi:glutaredoxin